MFSFIGLTLIFHFLFKSKIGSWYPVYASLKEVAANCFCSRPNFFQHFFYWLKKVWESFFVYLFWKISKEKVSFSCSVNNNRPSFASKRCLKRFLWFIGAKKKEFAVLENAKIDIQSRPIVLKSKLASRYVI